jgi:hypothetical protein
MKQASLTSGPSGATDKKAPGHLLPCKMRQETGSDVLKTVSFMRSPSCPTRCAQGQRTGVTTGLSTTGTGAYGGLVDPQTHGSAQGTHLNHRLDAVIGHATDEITVATDETTVVAREVELRTKVPLQEEHVESPLALSPHSLESERSFISRQHLTATHQNGHTDAEDLQVLNTPHAPYREPGS